MRIAVIGAGPSGAYLAYLLARSGFSPLLFDGSHPREKPCGGILSASFFSDFPVFNSFTHYQTISCDHYFTTPKQKCFKVKSEISGHSFIVTSRKLLDLYLIEQAVKAGTTWIQDHVVNLCKLSQTWTITTKSGRIYEADFIIGADGANSLTRKKTLTPFKNMNYGIGIGYRFPGQNNLFMHTALINKGLLGFIVPGYKQTLVLVGFKNGIHSPRDELDLFCSKYFNNNTPSGFFSGILPLASHPDFFLELRSGKDFLLIGDAAGFCNPKNGEGIPYALKSAAAAAKVLLSKEPENYEKQWRNSFGHELTQASRTLKYLPFMPLLEWSALFLSRSPSMTSLAYHLAKGTLFNKISLKPQLCALIQTPFEIIKGDYCKPPVP